MISIRRFFGSLVCVSRRTLLHPPLIPWVAAGLIAGLAASCAPLPPPQTGPPPPVERPAAEPTPVPVPAPQELRLRDEPTIDVGLWVDLDSLTIAPQRQSRLVTTSEVGETLLGSSRAPLLVRRARNGGEVFWHPEGGARLVTSLKSTDTLWVGLGDGDPGTEPRFRSRGKTWRGAIKVFLNPRGKLTGADRVPLETYLLGVVPTEIGALQEDLLEAGRAQAIAARSYTLFYRGRRWAEGFDVYGTVEDQVYGAVEDERTLATRCVETTRGQVALSQGRPIRANYSSTCGGITADVWEAWPAEPLPFLVSHRDLGSVRDYCSESSQYRWREEWEAREFLAKLKEYGPPEGVRVAAPSTGDLVDVRVESRSRSGRVWRLAVETTTGQVVIPAYSLRRVLRRPGTSQAILRSNLFKIDVRRDPATRAAVAVVATGAGSGHGVGLCQTGAIGMARVGETAERILRHYYSGIEIRRLY